MGLFDHRTGWTGEPRTTSLEQRAPLLVEPLPKETFQEHVDDGVRQFILDFSDTEVLDSTGLGSIFSLYRAISPDDGKVAFADVSEPVQVVVQLTRTYKVFRQFPSVDAAREAFSG
ncbi:STAS domain-containing protein [Salinibacter ruber]|uniref:STAS domain-containing protein n=1 Tax=Salinibacter ruber TaxID=146919 RepID=UPI00216712BE